MRKGINFAQLPATFPRKVSKENISNNCYHTSKDIDMFMQIKSVKGNIEGKSKNLDLTYIGLIYILVSYRMSFCLKLYQESFTAFKHRQLGFDSLKTHHQGSTTFVHVRTFDRFVRRVSPQYTISTLNSAWIVTWILCPESWAQAVKQSDVHKNLWSSVWRRSRTLKTYSCYP